MLISNLLHSAVSQPGHLCPLETCCVSLGKSLNLSESLFLIYKMRTVVGPPYREVVDRNWDWVWRIINTYKWKQVLFS